MKLRIYLSLPEPKILDSIRISSRCSRPKIQAWIRREQLDPFESRAISQAVKELGLDADIALMREVLGV